MSISDLDTARHALRRRRTFAGDRHRHKTQLARAGSLVPGKASPGIKQPAGNPVPTRHGSHRRAWHQRLRNDAGLLRSTEAPPPLRPCQNHTVHVRNVLKDRSEEHTSELQSLMRISYAVFCLKKKKK